MYAASHERVGASKRYLALAVKRQWLALPSLSVLGDVTCTRCVGGGGDGGGSDALLESSEGWGRLAAALVADVPQQPPGLVATLRDYQMHVRGREGRVRGASGKGRGSGEGVPMWVGLKRCPCCKGLSARGLGNNAAMVKYRNPLMGLTDVTSHVPPRACAASSLMGVTSRSSLYPQGLRWLVGLHDAGLNGILAGGWARGNGRGLGKAGAAGVWQVR